MCWKTVQLKTRQSIEVSFDLYCTNIWYKWMVGYMVHKRTYTCTIWYTRELTLVQYVTQENLHLYNMLHKRTYTCTILFWLLRANCTKHWLYFILQIIPGMSLKLIHNLIHNNAGTILLIWYTRRLLANNIVVVIIHICIT